jgi:predicted MFS family arabinose efflux permease
MIAARFVSGISACSWVTFTVLYASYYPPDQTARAMGHIAFCNGISIMAASFLGGWLADHYGWLAPFWASAAFGLTGALLSFFLKDPVDASRVRPTLRASIDIVKHPTLIWASVVAALGMYTVFTSTFGFLPNYAVTLGASKTQLGLLSTITLFFSSFAGLSVSRYTLPYFGPRRSIVLSYGIVTLITAAIPHTTSIYQLFALQAFSGIARGTAYPILMSLSINGLPDRNKATAMGFFQAVYSAGMFLGPVVAGQIGGWLGYTMLFTSSACVAAVSTLAALKLPSSIKD